MDRDLIGSEDKKNTKVLDYIFILYFWKGWGEIPDEWTFNGLNIFWVTQVLMEVQLYDSFLRSYGRMEVGFSHPGRLRWLMSSSRIYIKWVTWLVLMKA